MKTMINIFTILLIFSCASTEKTGELIEMRINSYTVECVGEMQGRCLLVQEENAIGTEDWELFYYDNSIKGFDHEPGYIYDLVLRKMAVEDPPMDGSAVRYELVKIRSKRKTE